MTRSSRATSADGTISLEAHPACVVADRLRASGYLTLRDVACEVRDGVAFLDGRLRSHYLKQIAQATAAEVDGIRAVDNRIEVIP